MDENIGAPQEEFTLKSFFGLLKRSGKRMLIFGIIAAVLGLIVSAIIIVCTVGKAEYHGEVEYTNFEIANGLDPNGDPINYMEIKNLAVINAALTGMGYDEEKTTRLAGLLENSIVIEPYISEAIAKQMDENPDFVYYPTRYKVILIPNDDLKMSKSELLGFVNQLMRSYMEQYKVKYKYAVELTSAIDADSVQKVIDYYDLIVLYQTQIDVMRATVNSLPSTYSAISAGLNAKIDLLVNYVAQLENYILSSNVGKEGCAMSLKDNLGNMIRDYTNIAERAKQESDELGELIKDYDQKFESASMNQSGVTFTAADLTAFNALVQQKQNAISQNVLYSSKAKLLEQKLAMIPDSPVGADMGAMRTYVENRFAALYTNLTDAISLINEEMAMYGEKTMMNSGIKITANAYKVQDISYLGAIVAFVVILLAGLVAAVITTAAKERKAKNSAKSATDSDTNTEVKPAE